jgi:hypothetical protein
MIMNTRSQDDLIATLHLEYLFEGQRVRHAAPAILSPNEHDANQLRQHTALVERLSVRAHDLPIKIDIDRSISRGAANIAMWRTYLPEDCIMAMVSQGWHWST